MSGLINRISLEYFRGATQPVELVIESGRPVVVIFGENGNGKSTIIDAIDFICNQNYGSLETKSITGKKSKYMPSLGADLSRLRVILDTQAGSFTAQLTSTGPTVVPKLGLPDVKILRRSELLKLIDTQPKERFEKLRDFIDVGGVEKSEQSLRETVKTIEKEYSQAVSSYVQAQQGLDNLWTKEGKPADSFLEWGKLESSKDVAALERELLNSNLILNSLQLCRVAKELVDRNLKSLIEMRNAKEVAKSELKIAEAKFSSQSSELLKILQNTKTFLSGDPTRTDCPACERPLENRNEFITSIDQRLTEMNNLAEKDRLHSQAVAKLESCEAIFSESDKELCNKLQTLGQNLKKSEFKLNDIDIIWLEYDVALESNEVSEKEHLLLIELYNLTLSAEATLISSRDDQQKSVNQQNGIKDYYDTYTSKLAESIGRESLLKKLKRALEIVSGERKAFVDEVLIAISTEVQNLYSKIHPDEQLGEVQFYLKPNVIGSLEFDGMFQQAKEVPPQAYYSESHLDTLGICVFIALAKHFKTDKTVLILDDVLTSVDGPHLDRFMKLLHEEALAFSQVILTTHYGLWKDRYRYGRGPTANTQLIELRRWNPAVGIQSDSVLSVLSELRQRLVEEPKKKQEIASKAGIQLECILDYLTFHFNCKVPRQKINEYTLGVLSNALDSKLTKLLKIQVLDKNTGERKETFLKPILDELFSDAWIRNRQGCHFSDLGSEIPDSSIIQFGSRVVQLSDLLICKSCNEFPESKPSGSYWECRCGTVHLYPLVHPTTAIQELNIEAQSYSKEKASVNNITITKSEILNDKPDKPQ
jgi:energy-coupling factor transporter ATP-binding protein EcfA2